MSIRLIGYSGNNDGDPSQPQARNARLFSLKQSRVAKSEEACYSTFVTIYHEHGLARRSTAEASPLLT